MVEGRDRRTEDNRWKIIEDYGKLSTVVRGILAVNRSIVVTIGTWDLLHIGHLRYLTQAAKLGDVLIVGVDTDEAVHRYKGPLRPIVPFTERCEMLSYQGCVDYVTGIGDVNKHGEWKYRLLRITKPDTFVAVEGSYPQRQLDDIGQYSKRLVVLPRQAVNTSTTNLIEKGVKAHLREMGQFTDGK